MSFSATKKDWSELYVFFRILADGKIRKGAVKNFPEEGEYLPVVLVRREEHDGTRDYHIEEQEIWIKGEKGEARFPREEFGLAAGIIFRAIKKAEGEEVEAPEGIEEFLDALKILNIASVTNDRTDFHIGYYAGNLPLQGMVVRSRIGKAVPLLDGSRSANVKLELSGVKFSVPTVNKVNAVSGPFEVTERLNLIERLGGVLKYADVADKVFRCNLQMIDLHFPRILTEMARVMHLEGITRVDELTGRIREINPLKIKEELIVKHAFYEYKMKQFLVAAALGMRPAKIYNGTDSAVTGFILLDGNGEIYNYHKWDKETLEEFLYRNTRLERGDTGKDKYGFLERENRIWYFKLNIKVGLLKR